MLQTPCHLILSTVAGARGLQTVGDSIAEIVIFLTIFNFLSDTKLLKWTNIQGIAQRIYSLLCLKGEY